MSVDQRMAAKATEEDAGGHLNPLIKERLLKPKNVFSPGHRIRMNIVPMFLNIFAPWGLFIFVMGIAAFSLMYMRPVMGYWLIGLCVLFWVATVLLAINRRKYDPEPSWYWFFSIMVGLAVFSGWLLGDTIYRNYSFPYYQIMDLKVLNNLDPSVERGQNVMDAGLFNFAEGSRIDATRAWHFKQKTVYCVAPIIKGDFASVPATQSFDFWAVGKDCCSVAASDFRCGSYANLAARGGIRNVNDKDQAFYRLAIEQATALYGIQSQHPVFFEWDINPHDTVSSWNQAGFKRYFALACFAFVVAVFAMAMATCKFSFMGRAESVYGEEIFNDADWKQGGVRRKLDLHVHERQV